MYADTPNYDEERGLTIPRVNMLLEQGSRRRAYEARSTASAMRVAFSDAKIEDAIEVPEEKRVADGGPAPAERDTTPWWED